MNETNEPAGLAELIGRRNGAPVKLHLGCGGTKWKDFINVDLHPAIEGVADSSREGCVADAFADMRNLGLPDGSVDEIFTAHTIEHFVRWEAIDMLKDWHRMLKSGGGLVLETADFARCVWWLFHPRPGRRHLARTQFYGNQWDRLDYETHRYLWSARELSRLLKQIGFRGISVTHRTWTHYPGRDMHVRAIK